MTTSLNIELDLKRVGCVFGGHNERGLSALANSVLPRRKVSLSPTSVTTPCNRYGNSVQGKTENALSQFRISVRKVTKPPKVEFRSYRGVVIDDKNC